ncbi:MAG: hypothetical protein HY909_19105 [Deltaproteobacteria bacterium]|nr:hypothetical protein [Deltaproteobacteria bacterium]
MRPEPVAPPMAGESLLHPVALAALALLLLNDHVLKQRFPGWWTGKLSDLAGMALFPLLLMGLHEAAAGAWTALPPPGRRALVGYAIGTALAFAAIKCWAPAAHGYRYAMGAVRWPLGALSSMMEGRPLAGVARVSLVQDPSDLVALPFTLPAVAARWRAVGAR